MFILKVTKSLKFAFINLLSTLGNIVLYILKYPQCTFSQSLNQNNTTSHHSSSGEQIFFSK